MVIVAFEPSGARIAVPAGSTLLDAARAVALPVARACGEDGICGRCALRVIAGADHLEAESADDAAVRRRNRVEDGARLACRTRVRGDVVVTASYW
jgi:uncharacterized 2Fe-2S/4Fe-4S cluster protein (DUF4445 family)